MSIRSSGYGYAEDVLLCQVYMEISQDPIVGVFQTSNSFWSRVEEKFNAAKDATWEERTKRSLQCRYQTIEKAVRKLTGCIRQIENMHPSGASNADILIQAKTLMQQDRNYKKGFKFDHVWHIVKDFEKFKDYSATSRQVNKIVNESSGSETPTPDSGVPASPGLSGFSIDLDASDLGGSSSGRPIGVKKAKLKRTMEEKESKMEERIDLLLQENRQVVDLLKKANTRSEKKHALEEFKEENKILFTKLNDIDDPEFRAFIKAEKRRIMHKRAQQHLPPPPTSDEFAQYFNDIGGSGSNLPEY